MKQTKLSVISGVPISTLAEWKRTKPKLRLLVELGAESYINSKEIYYKARDTMNKSPIGIDILETLIDICMADPSDDVNWQNLRNIAESYQDDKDALLYAGGQQLISVIDACSEQKTVIDKSECLSEEKNYILALAKALCE